MEASTKAEARTEAVDNYVQHLAATDDVRGRVASLGVEGVETRSVRGEGLVVTVAEELVETHSWPEIKSLISERAEADHDAGMGW